MNEVVTFEEIWKKLSAISTGGHTKEKESDHGKTLSYLPWAVAWKMLIEVYPNSTYIIHENDDKFPCFYNELGGICKTTVEIEGHKRSMTLPVMDYANKAMKPDAYTYSTKNGEKSVNPLNTFAINKTNFRCLVKNLAMFGLGIDIYIGDDLTLMPDEEENKEPWEISRNSKIGGNGKNKDKTWIEVEGGYLSWCVDPKNEKFARKLAPKASKEIDWRTGQQELNDFDMSKNTKPVDKELEFLREDVQAQADLILKSKYGKEIQYGYFSEKIQEANDKQRLTLINSRIQAIDTLVTIYKGGLINDIRYIKDLKDIVVADNGKLDNIVNELHKLDPEGAENRSYLEHYHKTIEKQWTALKYDDIPKLAIHSMEKHLGTDDMYTITDWHILKKYSSYLSQKMFDNENKPKVEKPKPIVREPVDDGDIPFPSQKKQPISNPNHSSMSSDDLDLG